MAGFAALKLNQSYSQHHSLTYQSSEPVTVFCDFDGPIIDVSDRYYSTYKLGLVEVQAAYQKQAILQKQATLLPLHILSKEQFWQMKQERTPDTEIALRSGLRGQQIELFLQRVRQIVNQADLLHQDHLQPGTRWALLQLHAQNIPLILVTLRLQSQAVQLLRQFGIAHLFTQIHGASDDDAAYLNQAEHKTQLLSNAMTEAGLSSVKVPSAGLPSRSPYDCSQSKHSAWMIGDTEADILAGQTLGMPTIALTCGIRSQAYLQRFMPTHVHSDLASAAHYLVKSAQIAA